MMALTIDPLLAALILDRILNDGLRKTCGQFVDRILSTQPITNGKEWEGM